MTDRPSVLRRQSGYGEGGPPFRGGPIFNLPLPIGPIVLYTTLASLIAFLGASRMSPGPVFTLFAFVPIDFVAKIENGDFLAAVVPLIGHAFLHGGPGHLLINMLWLMVFGSGIARRLCVEGVAPQDRGYNVAIFMAFYISCAIAGALTHFVSDPLDATPMVGASGAISGLLGGTLRFALRLYAPMGAQYGRLAPFWAKPVLIGSAIYIGLNIVTGIVGAAGVEDAARIAWEAHVGGFVFGLLAFPLFDRLAKRPPLPFGLG